MKILEPGTCALCKHWDESARRSVAAWAKEAEPNWTPYRDGPCSNIREKIDTVVIGDGYLESLDTDADFGCKLFESAEDN